MDDNWYRTNGRYITYTVNPRDTFEKLIASDDMLNLYIGIMSELEIRMIPDHELYASTIEMALLMKKVLKILIDEVASQQTDNIN